MQVASCMTMTPLTKREKVVTCGFARCMTQPGSDEMVYRVLLEHANNSAKSSDHSVQSETNSASDLGGGVAFNIYVT